MPHLNLPRTNTSYPSLTSACLIILLLAASKFALADWQSFKSAPVESIKSETIRGLVSKPEGDGPFPAVILAHGCLGVGPNQHDWAKRLTAWGYVTIIVDSFSTRDVKDVCSNAWKVSPETRSFDAYGAAAYLRQQKFVNPGKVGMIGFSHGGWTALFTAQSDFPEKAQQEPLQAIVAYYPWCPWFGLKQASTPLLMLIGDADNWTPINQCRRLLNNQEKKYRKNVNLLAYDDAYHGFDDASRDPPVDYKGFIIAFDPSAAAKSFEDAKRFLKQHLGP